MDLVETNTDEVVFYEDDPVTNRKKLFEDALSFAKNGKVLYILQKEFDELPELSQDLTLVSKQYMKMISFLYADTLKSLVESLSSLPDWHNVPSLIILEDINKYSNNIQNVCGIVALLIDSARSCTAVLKCPCTVHISAAIESFGESNCNIIRELYCGGK